MLKIFVKIVHILDGTPAIYGERRRGQSVVELALITPILITLLAGLVEVGWFANNYLTLLDVSRAGARRGTVLQDSQSPLFWDNRYSLVPQYYFDSQPGGPFFKTDFNLNGLVGESDNLRDDVRYHRAFNQSACESANRTFYHEVACVMIASLAPLRFDEANGVDDIIISGISLENVDASRNPRWLGLRGTNWRPIDADVPQLVVVGRYPINANECDVAWDGVNTPAIVPLEERDPFDFNYNLRRDLDDSGDEDAPYSATGVRLNPNGEDDFNEIPGYDGLGASLGAAEKQIGFSLFGNHRITGTACIGSEWTIREIAQQFNLQTSFGLESLANPDMLAARRMIPGQGIILVEMFWQHHLLLNIPLLSPVFVALGSERTTISVWAAFPLPTVEPFIVFD